jgi:hypothetical protein
MDLHWVMHRKCGAVITAHSSIRPEPREPPTVLYDHSHFIEREALINVEMLEIDIGWLCL